MATLNLLRSNFKKTEAFENIKTRLLMKEFVNLLITTKLVSKQVATPERRISPRPKFSYRDRII